MFSSRKWVLAIIATLIIVGVVVSVTNNDGESSQEREQRKALEARALFGNSDQESQEQGYQETGEEVIEREEALEPVPGTCVDAGPLDTDLMNGTVNVVNCDKSEAAGVITDYPEDYCQPGYVSPETGNILEWGVIEGEEVCVEAYYPEP